MAKPYGHQYFFAGVGHRYGSMVCAGCGQPIVNETQDWMVYEKTCRDTGGTRDWKYVTLHRTCTTKQSGWEALEKTARQRRDKIVRIEAAIAGLCESLKISRDELLAHLEIDHEQ